jgi:hypothetical protein
MFITYIAVLIVVTLLGCTCQAAGYPNCKKKVQASLFSRDDVDEKLIRDLNRKYSWCVESHMCGGDDILRLVTFLEDQCEFDGLTLQYVQEPYGMRNEVFTLLRQNWHLFKR